MKKNVFFGLLVFMLALGMINCDDGNNETEFKSPFIGSWKVEDSGAMPIDWIFTISENTFSAKDQNGNYRFKGNWKTESLNKFIFTQTHSGDVEKIDDLITLEEDYDVEYTYEFLSNSHLKFIHETDGVANLILQN